MSARSPVLFLVFNRPDTTARVFQAIRAARPPRLYVSADGPRASRLGEAERCEAVRRIATAVDWPCEVFTLFHPENLGCRLGVSAGITWFFQHEPEGIILEDDCLPELSFFGYCDELLERYRDDPRVMCISGDSPVSNSWQPDESYYFSKFAMIWGWASWRRAWLLYDGAIEDWQRGDKDALLTQWMPGERRAQLYWRSRFDGVAAGRIDSWAYQWVYACWCNSGVSIIPTVNVVSNIGFGDDATHTKDPTSERAARSTKALVRPLRHPRVVEPNRFADSWISRHTYGIDERLLSLATVKGGVRRIKGVLRRIWNAVLDLTDGHAVQQDESHRS